MAPFFISHFYTFHLITNIPPCVSGGCSIKIQWAYHIVMKSQSSETPILYILKEMVLFYFQVVWQYMEMETFHLRLDEYEEQANGYRRYEQISVTDSQKSLDFVWFFRDEAQVSLSAISEQNDLKVFL